MTLEYEAFAVNDNMHCMWDAKIHETNDDFLRDFNTCYFDESADLLLPFLDDEKVAQTAALIIRTLFSQSIETMFALMFAAIQAPNVPLGWLLRYRPGDLSDLVLKFQNGTSFPIALDIQIGSWQQLAYVFNPFLVEDEAQTCTLKQSFADFWSWLSSDYIEESYNDEYNSLKHGFRIRQGGFTALFGGHLLSSSRFGSSFFSRKSVPGAKSSFWIERCSRNWDPRGMCAALSVVSASINNIVSSLRLIRGEGAESVSFHSPNRLENFDAFWENSKCIGGLRFNGPSIEAGDLPNWSKAQLEELYRKRQIKFDVLSAGEVRLAPNPANQADS